MKFRKNHVSNSSSCSFIIKDTSCPFEDLYDQITAKTSQLNYDESWIVIEDYEEDGTIYCSTFVDNFNLYKYVTEYLHYPEKYIEIIHWG